MENLVSVNPGLMIWTLIIFTIFFLLIAKFGAKPIANALQQREKNINDAIDNANTANKTAQDNLQKTQEKLDNAQKEMADIIAKARVQAEKQLQKASEEADKLKLQKVDDATKEIERKKEEAIAELRREIAGLVVEATERILEEKIDPAKDQKLIESYIQKLPKN